MGVAVREGLVCDLQHVRLTLKSNQTPMTSYHPFMCATGVTEYKYIPHSEQIINTYTNKWHN